jgi:putative phosphoribosyl transferase
MFTDRKEAGQALAGRLASYKGASGVVLGIPRGGIPIGYEIAKALNWPLDIALSKKIGHPTNKEYAIGAVSLNGYVINQKVPVSRDYLETEIARIRQGLQTTYERYLQQQAPLLQTGKNGNPYRRWCGDRPYPAVSDGPDPQKQSRQAGCGRSGIAAGSPAQNRAAGR